MTLPILLKPIRRRIFPAIENMAMITTKMVKDKDKTDNHLMKVVSCTLQNTLLVASSEVSGNRTKRMKWVKLVM